MTTLADMPFKTLQAGMKFRHHQHGDQVVLDLGQGAFGPVISFHATDVYSGRPPHVDLEEEGDIFQALAHSTFPYGAENWEYVGMITPEEVAAHGWHWYKVACPHCGSAHHVLAASAPPNQRQCRVCGMVFVRPAQLKVL